MVMMNKVYSVNEFFLPLDNLFNTCGMGIHATQNPSLFQDSWSNDEQGRRRANHLGKAFLGKKDTSAINQNQ